MPTATVRRGVAASDDASAGLDDFTPLISPPDMRTTSITQLRALRAVKGQAGQMPIADESNQTRSRRESESLSNASFE
jgi:hypothetical protein